MRWFIVMICLMAFLLAGCATTDQYRAYVDAYKAYIASQMGAQRQNPPKVCEFKAGKQVTIPEGFELTCYAPQGQGARTTILKPPEQIDQSRYYQFAGGAIRTVASLALGWKGFDVAGSVLETALKNAGHNTTTTQTWGDYSGNGQDGYRLTDNSIHDSYNPVSDSYNTDNSIHDSHDQNWTDDHSVDNHSSVANPVQGAPQ